MKSIHFCQKMFFLKFLFFFDFFFFLLSPDREGGRERIAQEEEGASGRGRGALEEEGPHKWRVQGGPQKERKKREKKFKKK